MTAPAEKQEIVANRDAVHSFLAAIVREAIHCVAIMPDVERDKHTPETIGGRLFWAKADEATDWALDWNARGANVYWTANRVRAGKHRKPTKADITEARFVHVDVDPPKDGRPFDRAKTLGELKVLTAPPSFIVDSGGGLQALWRLQEAVTDLDAVESINLQVRDLFTADHCQNIDRLMRVPGTVNWPDAAKRARGRVPALASLLTPDSGKAYPAAEIAAAFPPAKPKERTAAGTVDCDCPLLTADALDLDAFSPIRSVIDRPVGDDRSRDALRCAGDMARAGYSREQVLGVILNPANAVAAHNLAQADPRRAALRVIEIAFDRPGKEHGANNDTGALPIEWGEEIEPQLSGLWLIKQTLPQIGIAAIYGHAGSGKSFLAVDFAMHVALGWEWNDMATRQGLVVYVGAEGQQGLRNRIVAFRRHYGIEGSLPLALIPCPIDLQDPKADRGRLAAAVRVAVERYQMPVALIVVDTLSKTFGAGKENTDDMALYVANCGWLASEFECCVMPVHHRPKDQESTDLRGHSSLRGGVDTAILVETGQPRKARIIKQKDAPERDLGMFNLIPVDLGADEDGELVTSCIVQSTLEDRSPRADPFTMAVAGLPTVQKLIYRQLVELTTAAVEGVPSEIPDGEINRLRVGKVVSLDAWRDKSILAAGTEAGHERDSGRKAFNRALPKLQVTGVVRVWGKWAWITHEIIA